MSKPFFHELSTAEFQKHIDEGKTWQFIMDTYSEPEWCGYGAPGAALEGVMGCWSLVDRSGENRISEEFCKDCDCNKSNLAKSNLAK